MTFAGKIAAVTGAASGLGREIASRLADEGAMVERLDRDIAPLRASSLPGDARVLDVSDPVAVAACFDAIGRSHGRLDVLVNCAGIREVAPALELSAAEWREVIEVNLGGTFHCAQAAARIMAANGSGAIVNLASTSALQSDPSRVAYCASKAGILGLTRSLALDLGPAGVRVNAVCPGLTRTPLTERYFDDRGFVEDLAHVVPLGTAAEVGDVAAAVLFLASDAARQISGVALPVDGGFLAGKSWSPRPDSSFTRAAASGR